jgi:glycosyltransferase involved in cell wall biosynthesis
MDNNNLEKIKNSISNLRNKKSKIYFMVQDTKGNAKASVKYIYEMAMVLKNNGFNVIILHEKPDYTGVGKWLGVEYEQLPHQPIEGQNLEVAPEDFLVLPEIFGYAMDQIKSIPCGRIVLTQSYRYILETLQPGQNWAQFGFLKCITTSLKQKDYIEKIMKQTTFDIIEPLISEYFEPRKLPAMPIVAVHTRDQSDTINLIKTFYLKFPQYRWFTFKDMRGLSEKEFAETLKECFLSVWIDDDSSFGTFPLESMSCGVPVIAKVPNIQPEWMEENNGIWVTDKTLMTDFVADFIQNWLEDNVKPDLYEEMEKTSKKYKNKQLFESNVVKLFEGYLTTRAESFESQISKN